MSDSIKPASINAKNQSYYLTDGIILRFRHYHEFVDPESVDRAVEHGRLLRITTANGTHVHPVFQFDNYGVIPEIAQIIGILKNGGMDPESILAWLRAALTNYADRDFDYITIIAREDITTWVPVSGD